MPIPQKLLDDAMAGNSSAQLEIGRCYAEGTEVSYDRDEAYRWFRLAANHKLPEALLEVALAHEYGLGTDVDYDAAFDHYMQAIRLHPKPIPFTLRGMVLTQNLCMAKHRGQLALAEAGYAHSQWAFAFGPERVNQWNEHKDSNKWTRRAAELGYPPAFQAMAWTIAGGKGLPSDEDKTLEWHLKAYEHNKLMAKSISSLYEPSDPSSWLSKHLDPKVRGVVPDKAKSEEWNLIWQSHRRELRMLAAAGGADYGAKELGSLFLEGKEDAPQDYTEAMKWFLRATELGDTWSCGQIAKMHLRGLGMPMDVEKGLAWLDRQFAMTFCNGSKVIDHGVIYHWAMRPIVEGYFDHLDEDALFAWLQARTRIYVDECGAMSGNYYGESETAHLAVHVCKAFRKYTFLKEELKPDEQKIVDNRVGRITRLMERQKAGMIELAKSGDASAQFWYSKTFTKYKGRGGNSLKWLLKSAEQGFSPAQYEAGHDYVRGDGAPVSETDARKWFLKASLQGHTWAQDELIRILSGSQSWGDYDKDVQRKPTSADLLEGYAWAIACDQRRNESKVWGKYSPAKVLAAYRRADEIRTEISKRTAA
jgi:TPR repeat protein